MSRYKLPHKFSQALVAMRLKYLNHEPLRKNLEASSLEESEAVYQPNSSQGFNFNARCIVFWVLNGCSRALIGVAKAFVGF